MDRVAAFVVASFVALSSAIPVGAATLKCAVDAVKVGDTCVDKYEASVWQVPDPSGTGKGLVKKIEKGKATLADLAAGGAVQLGCNVAPINHTAYPSNFPDDGNWTPILGSSPPTPGVYAVSVAGTLPTACTSQPQAIHACRLSGKHLITNAEWQAAAAGTPDPGTTDDNATQCEIGADGGVYDAAPTGSRSACISRYGAYDMVGNVEEWVSDWAEMASGETTWFFGTGDRIAFGGDASAAYLHLPAVAFRGGAYNVGADAGVFAINAGNDATYYDDFSGFRCAR